MNIDKDIFEQKYKKEIEDMKEQIKKVNFNKVDFDDEDIVFYYDVDTNKILSGKYEYLKIYADEYHFYKTEEEAKEYGEFFMQLSDVTSKALGEKLESQFNDFVNIKDVALGDKNTYYVREKE